MDVDRVEAFVDHYRPKANILFVRIQWGAEGDFCYIPMRAQRDLLSKEGKGFYIKRPKRGTNPRGVEIAAPALKRLVNQDTTHRFTIDWRRDQTLIKEKALYQRWIELWDSL